MSRPARSSGLAVAASLALLALAACGSTPTTAAGAAPTRSDVPAVSLATSFTTPGGVRWATVPMGASPAQHEQFWELLVSGADGHWTLATPSGVASNGGIAAAATGPASLLAAFRPSQDLTFSPLAATTDNGAHWAQGDVLDAGLAAVPGALASSPAGRLLALTSTGRAELGTASGARWTSLTSARSLGHAAAARACGLTALTAAGWTPAGQPLLGGTCGTPGRAGIFVLDGRTWRLSAPALPAADAADAVTVLGIATAGARAAAVLAAGTGRDTSVRVAWSPDSGRTWTLSAPLPTPDATGDRAASVAFGADASVSIVLPGISSRTAGRGASIAWQAAGWQQLPPLPAGTVTLAARGTTPQALAVHGGTLTVWQLRSGGDSWAPAQTVRVTIPYGSSS